MPSVGSRNGGWQTRCATASDLPAYSACCNRAVSSLSPGGEGVRQQRMLPDRGGHRLKLAFLDAQR